MDNGIEAVTPIEHLLCATCLTWVGTFESCASLRREGVTKDPSEKWCLHNRGPVRKPCNLRGAEPGPGPRSVCLCRLSITPYLYTISF
jgi:hypothetical protein